MDSILLTIKKMIGGWENEDAFDTDLIVHINSYLNTLNQLGVGPDDPFVITGSEETWEDFLGEDIKKLELVKTYLYANVKIAFDPPSTSFGIDALKEIAKEAEWRLNVMVDPKEE
ncbi:MAG: hypothetical protein IJJ10_03225 [Bacillus sp. (in: Bacteria)]|nr:hypothetical protein [Bacillus sp. (in: firmicutes)]